MQSTDPAPCVRPECGSGPHIVPVQEPAQIGPPRPNPALCSVAFNGSASSGDFRRSRTRSGKTPRAASRRSSLSEHHGSLGIASRKFNKRRSKIGWRTSIGSRVKPESCISNRIGQSGAVIASSASGRTAAGVASARFRDSQRSRSPSRFSRSSFSHPDSPATRFLKQTRSSSACADTGAKGGPRPQESAPHRPVRGRTAFFRSTGGNEPKCGRTAPGPPP